MADTVPMVVTTFNSREEINVPAVFISAGSTTPTRQLLSFLTESGISYPEDGMVTETESGLVFHAVPKFG